MQKLFGGPILVLRREEPGGFQKLSDQSPPEMHCITFLKTEIKPLFSEPYGQYVQWWSPVV